MSTSDTTLPSRKICFVSIGATAAFDSLIRATLSPTFLEVLKQHRYTDLCIQHGEDGRTILQESAKHYSKNGGHHGIKISGFAFNKRGLGAEMRAAKGHNNSDEGVVISHAGSGSILDALRIAAPLIVVPNPDLLDNHQVELAEELAARGYVVHGHLKDLPAAIRQSESLRKTQHSWPPASEGADPSGKGLIGVMDDELGFVD